MNYKNKIQFNYKMISYTFYQIVCNDETVKESYVGSTVNLEQRIDCHKSKYNNSNLVSYNYKIYQFIRNNGYWSNFKFNILEIRDCINEYEAYKIEISYINSLKPELNSYSPPLGLTKQEYYNLHKEKLNKRTKEWKELNKEKYKESYKRYYQENKERCKHYYQENKEKLNKKINCECGGKHTYGSKSEHLTTKKHSLFLEKSKISI